MRLPRLAYASSNTCTTNNQAVIILYPTWSCPLQRLKFLFRSRLIYDIPYPGSFIPPLLMAIQSLVPLILTSLHPSISRKCYSMSSFMSVDVPPANTASTQEVNRLGLFSPLPIPRRVWEDISMDFITHLPNSSSKIMIWVVVDRLSKYAHFVALPSKFSAPSLAATFATESYCLHGIPKTIVNGRDRLFLSQF
ncbi:UNVERIFIED_CONTAM: hypothetical protein Slati_2485500 [Sesamum latifolium]|uniref:Integrase catalytic domain-containing protein n=1 Tax=Sesamum latifolium TaxID=2727402 RepID=A0AAW2WIJ8_9LAMI